MMTMKNWELKYNHKTRVASLVRKDSKARRIDGARKVAIAVLEGLAFIILLGVVLVWWALGCRVVGGGCGLI